MSLITKTCLLWSVLVLASTAIADDGYERVDLLSGHIDLRPGESTSVSLPGGWRQIRKLYITANAYYGDATLQVFVNGDEKGRVFVPRVDPYYIVNIDETAARVTLSNARRGGVIRISGLKADLSFQQFDPIVITPEPISFPALNEAANLARRGVQLVDALRPYADPETEYIQFLLPIKRVSGRALALANARGDGSLRVRQALEALAQQIQFADAYIETTLKKEASFERAVQLLALRDSILDWLD